MFDSGKVTESLINISNDGLVLGGSVTEDMGDFFYWQSVQMVLAVERVKTGKTNGSSFLTNCRPSSMHFTIIPG